MTHLAALARDVREGFSRLPKQIPAQYLYDDLGSALFEAICELPWYRITRAETALLGACSAQIAARFAEPPFVVELGPGSGDKLLRLAQGFSTRPHRAHLHLIDISQSALAAAQRSLARLSGFTVTVARATYEEGLGAIADLRPAGSAMLTLVLGSNIGNFQRQSAVALLRRIRDAGRPGDRLLLGADLVKPESELALAYDDPLGVTAAFNRNLLVRLNRELGATFDLAQFDHHARWNAEQERMEMHLASRCAQRVSIPGAGIEVDFAARETIWTESSCKYSLHSLGALVAEAGFDLEEQWLDAEAGFALSLFRARAAIA